MRAVGRFRGCQLSTVEVCDLLETIVNLRPALCETLIEASQQLRQLRAKAEELPQPSNGNHLGRPPEADQIGPLAASWAEAGVSDRLENAIVKKKGKYGNHRKRR